MASSDSTGDSAVRTASQFATTHWSVVLAAADSAAPAAQEAREELCRTYWYPLYAFVRMKGHDPETAKDLTQAFFEKFLEKKYVRHFAREKGRFRTYLLSILQHFLCDEYDRVTAVKRGGGLSFVPLDTSAADSQIEEAALVQPSPEATFERAWAETVVQAGVERLRSQYEADGSGKLFEELRAYLSHPADRAAYAISGGRLQMTPEAIAMAVMRLRRRYREAVRATVANTVATPAEIDDEMRYLVGLLTG
jgi:RNA polymerase sigma-70 factor (ECF subfamily)